MGFNATVVVICDALDQIARDTSFGEKLARAIQHKSCFSEPVDVEAGNHGNAATVVETHHADQTAVVAVGGNYASVMLNTFGYSHHKPEDQVRILRELANSMGFRIARKPTKNPAQARK